MTNTSVHVGGNYTWPGIPRLINVSISNKDKLLAFLRIFTLVCAKHKHNIVSRIIHSTTLISKWNANTLGLSLNSITRHTFRAFPEFYSGPSCSYRILYRNINNESNCISAFCLCVLLKHIVCLYTYSWAIRQWIQMLAWECLFKHITCQVIHAKNARKRVWPRCRHWRQLIVY